MRHLFITILTAVICLFAFAVSSQNLSLNGMSSEIEDAFLDKPRTPHKQEKGVTQVPDRSISDETILKRKELTENEIWQGRLETILDIPKSPLPEGILLKMLKTANSKFLVAVYNTKEENVVYKTRQIIWSRVKMLFVESEMPLIHIVPVSGGTFSIGKAFYTIMNEKDGFSIFYIPRGSDKKMSLTFSGGEGALLTPEGFVCRIRKHVPNVGGDK